MLHNDNCLELSTFVVASFRVRVCVPVPVLPSLAPTQSAVSNQHGCPHLEAKILALKITIEARRNMTIETGARNAQRARTSYIRVALVNVDC